MSDRPSFCFVSLADQVGVGGGRGDGRGGGGQEKGAMTHHQSQNSHEAECGKICVELEICKHDEGPSKMTKAQFESRRTSSNQQSLSPLPVPSLPLMLKSRTLPFLSRVVVLISDELRAHRGALPLKHAENKRALSGRGPLAKCNVQFRIVDQKTRHQASGWGGEH